MLPFFSPQDEITFVISFIIGIAFGFILEQAGFSSSRKLAGVFYGYDFVVVRVFFTAAITTMLGLIFLNYFGYLNFDDIFINSTYLWATAVGGAIMGLGFIIGGFCPGTSVCALAIGKIDAMIFVGGIFIGAFIFGEAYPIFKDIYMEGNLGRILIYDTLGISQGTFAFSMILIALIMFWGSYFIQKKISKKEMKY